MEKIFTEKIDEILMTRVEYLHHMKSSYEVIMNEVLRKRSKYEYNKDLVDYYMEKYNNIFNEFSILTNDIIKEINPEYLDNKKYYVEFSFEEEAVNIYERKTMGTVPRQNCKNDGK